jgi:hypothetical protein
MIVTMPRFRPTARHLFVATSLLTSALSAAAHTSALAQNLAQDLAQDAWRFAEPSATASASPADAPVDASTDNQIESQSASDKPEVALPDPSTIDWSILNTDTTATLEARKQLAPTNKPSDTSAWSRSDKSAGFSAVTVKQPIAPFWDTRVGADFSVAGQSPSVIFLPEKIATDGRLSQSSGAAWAAMTAPGLGEVWDKTSIEARLDPSQDQSKIGTTLSKTLPIDSNAYSLTLQGGYNVIEQSLVPVVGVNGRIARSYELDRTAKFNVLDTGTSLLAGQSLSTTDDKWLNSVGAEQKLFGGVTVSGTVSETVAGNLNKSLTAGFKHNW